MPALKNLRQTLARALPRNATAAWLWMLAVTVLTLALAIAERGRLPWMGWLVAALVAFKAHLVAVHFLEVRDAGKVFGGIVKTFWLIAPLALVTTAWLEA